MGQEPELPAAFIPDLREHAESLTLWRAQETGGADLSPDAARLVYRSWFSVQDGFVRFRGTVVGLPGREQRGQVLHVITDTNRRGAQVFACELAESLAEIGRPGTVVAMQPGGSGSQLSVPVLSCTPGRASKLRSLRRLMSTSCVVVAHGSGTLLACVLAGFGLRIPVIYRNISDPEFWMSTPSRRARVRMMLSQVDHVVALWQGGADYMQQSLGVAHAKVSVVPNAVDSATFRRPDPQERLTAKKHFALSQAETVVLFAAALQPEKHAETAVLALAQLSPQAMLLIAGDGPKREEIRRLAHEVAPGRVVLAGQIADMRLAYWASDVIVLPSEGEGLPAVLIEAALSGVPAVASTSGGNAGIVRDGVTGRLVAPADHRQLAEMIRDVSRHSTEMGNAAAVHCSRTFDLRKVTEGWATVLDGVAPAQKREPPT